MAARVAFYACGGGFGHGARALGLARACRARGMDVLVLAPRRVGALARWAGIRHLAPPVEPPDAGELRCWVAATLARFRPDALVVDVFARGILGELGPLLPDLAPHRTLVCRHVDPRFYALPGMQAVLAGYHLVLATEPPPAALRGHPGLVPLPPVTLVSADELLDRARAPVLGVLDLTGPLRVLPAAPVLRGALAVVAHAGYASYYEILQAGVPAVLLPRRRPLDDQFARARGLLGLGLRAPHEVVPDLTSVPAALRRLTGAQPVEPLDLGGARQGARLLERALTGTEPPVPGGLPRAGSTATGTQSPGTAARSAR